MHVRLCKNGQCIFQECCQNPEDRDFIQFAHWGLRKFKKKKKATNQQQGDAEGYKK